MSELKRKGILLLLSVLMLVSAGAYLTFAWYTKVTSVSSMTFEAAQWEFTANYEVSDFEINVNSYTTSNEGMAAPGTAGVIPIRLSATNSHTDVYYQIRLDKSTMDPRFQERIFFSKDAACTQSLETKDAYMDGVIDVGGSQKYVDVKIYWKWIYEFDELEDIPVDVEPIEKNAAEFDAFDTQVGKNPELYEDMMSATITIVGTQRSPIPDTSTT